MHPKWLNVGKVVNTHGIRGELKIFPTTDFPEVRFQKGKRLHLMSPEGRVLDMEVDSARLHKNMYILKFKQLENMNEAEKYKGWMVKVPAEEQVELAEGEYYFHQIIGCKVMTEDGREIGKITEILTPGANDVWVVSRPPKKPVLLPVIDEVVLDVDVERKIVRIHPMEGLL